MFTSSSCLLFSFLPWIQRQTVTQTYTRDRARSTIMSIFSCVPREPKERDVYKRIRDGMEGMCTDVFCVCNREQNEQEFDAREDFHKERRKERNVAKRTTQLEDKRRMKERKLRVPIQFLLHEHHVSLSVFPLFFSWMLCCYTLWYISLLLLVQFYQYICALLVLHIIPFFFLLYSSLSCLLCIQFCTSLFMPFFSSIISFLFFLSCIFTLTSHSFLIRSTC